MIIEEHRDHAVRFNRPVLLADVAPMALAGLLGDEQERRRLLAEMERRDVPARVHNAVRRELGGA